jgi:hypothetical protein
MTSFTLAGKLSIEKLNPDNQSSYRIPYSVDKSYSLMPETSIRFDNRFFIQPGVDKLTGVVEVSLTNTLRDKAIISKLQVLDTKDARVVDLKGVDVQRQEISRRSTFKFLIRYDLNRDAGMVKDYGRIQFVWKSENQEIEGGILAYNVICNLEKRPDDLSIERADEVILKKFEIAEVKLTLVNL